MKKILLGQGKGKREVNETNFTGVELASTEHILPVDRITQTLDSYKEYLSEKDSSQIYRLIFTINPVCTNILFNLGTEIVYKEGSDECTCLDSTGNAPNNNELKKYQRDYKSKTAIEGYSCKFCGTSYTGPVPTSPWWCTAGCGRMNPPETTPSFNSLLTRADAIRDTAYSHPEIGNFTYHCGVDIFNNHMLRNREFKVVNKLKTADRNFNTIKDYLRDADGNIINEKLVKYNGISVTSKIHLYQVDDIRTYQESVHDNLVESNGWVGFINPATMNIANYVTGDTSVTINKCMNNNKAGEFIDMYPDRSLYSFTPKYNKYRNRLEYNWDYFITYPYSADTGNTLILNGIRCYFYDLNELSESYFAKGNSGETNFVVHMRTQIKNAFYKGSFANFSFGGDAETEVPVKVENIGFNGDDTQHVFSVNFESLVGCLMTAGVNSGDQSWRSKISNLQIRVRKNVRGTDCKYYIRKFKCINKNLNNSINPLAFAENIYSDKVSQIVFNDDIVTSGLTDNLGRQVSEVFLTIVKRNKGNDEWYLNKNYTADTVEFSHCFGKVSSGFDMAPSENEKNIHYLTATNRNRYALEDDINDSFEEFYGDIVEFSPMTIEETVLEDVYHRFNTMQRETQITEYSQVIYDSFISDDYDVSTSEGFRVQEKTSDFSNICDEGYYYKPHYRVKLRAFDETVKQGSHIKMSFISGLSTNDNQVFSGTTNVPYGIVCYTDDSGLHSDALYLIDKDGKRVDAKVLSVSGPLRTEIVFSADTIVDISNYNVFKPNIMKPAYAYELNDGTGRYLWRDILPDNKILYGDELYDSTFTNGAHYFHLGINFYLKRQDPFGEYGLNVRNTSGNMDTFTGASEGEFKEISTAEYKTEGENDIC